MNDFWNQLLSNPDIPHAAAVVLILAAGLLFARYLIGPIQRGLERVGVSPVTLSFVVNTLRAGLFLAIVLAVLQQLGVVTTSLLALLGASGAAVALSLNTTMANFAAGLVLLGNRMVRLRDVIEIGDVRGQVVELQPFHVVVITADQVRVTLPNSLLINGPLRNHSALPTRRVQWILPIPDGAEISAARSALLARLQADSRILPTPAPSAFVSDWLADRRVLTVQAWTASADASAVQEGMLEELGRTVQELGTPPK
jgi:small conductance mechanosensitive channel